MDSQEPPIEQPGEETPPEQQPAEKREINPDPREQPRSDIAEPQMPSQGYLSQGNVPPQGYPPPQQGFVPPQGYPLYQGYPPHTHKDFLLIKGIHRNRDIILDQE